MKNLDLIGIGIGPFNLSLAALSDTVKDLNAHFFERKASFEWHSEIIFKDSYMQTSFLKDLVTGVDPTNPYSYLNFLVQSGLFYSFMNTGKSSVTRKEFETYCQWVASKLSHRLSFGSNIESVDYDGKQFNVKSNGKEYQSKHICVGTGLIPKIPEFCKSFLGSNLFHAKSPQIKNINFENKNVVIIGGGQTGIEIFRNGLNNHWGKPKSIKIVTSRANLEPLDNSPFTNEYFTPHYIQQFFKLSPEFKEPITSYQKLASDGNTPEYLEELYNDLYRIKNIEKDQREIEILPYRRMEDLDCQAGAYRLRIFNNFYHQYEQVDADIVILATGFQSAIPSLLDPIKHLIKFDEKERFVFNEDFSLQWDGEPENKIFALNFSRHGHGIAEPQTSLMAWRSANVINSVTGNEHYKVNQCVPNFVNYGKPNNEI